MRQVYVSYYVISSEIRATLKEAEGEYIILYELQIGALYLCGILFIFQGSALACRIHLALVTSEGTYWNKLP